VLRPDRVKDSSADRVSLFRLISYVMPSLALAAVGMPLVVHLPNFYASKEVGLSLVVTGLVFTLMRALDVVIDPVAGYVSDRLRTRFGRRRPMLALGAPLLAIGIWMVFVPGGRVSAVHLGASLFVMYLGWSMCIIPHLSWGSELSGDYHERSRIYGWSQAFTVAGMTGVLVLPAILEHVGVPQHSTQIMAMAIFSIVTLLAGVLLCVLAVPEPQVKLQSYAPLLPTLRFLFRNRAMLQVLGIDFTESLNQGARGAVFFYFAGIGLGVPHAANTILLVYFVSGVLCIPLWMALSRRIGKHRALIAAYIYGFCMAPLLFVIPSGNVLAATVVLAISGANYGAPAFLVRSMMADVADVDTAQNKAERAGVMYSFLSLTAKFGIGLSVLITFFTLSLIGFDPKAAHVAPDLALHLRVVYVTIPVILGVVSLLLTLGYPIDEKKQRALRDEIERMRAGHHSAEDAVPPGILASGGALASIRDEDNREMSFEAKEPAE
jgi:GPH family glycoside/pentoside/hexuronide:cation symporter